MTDFELRTPGGYTTNTGEFRADRKPAVLRLSDVPDTDRVMIRITQPGWDMNRVCFAEFRREDLMGFFARVLDESEKEQPAEQPAKAEGVERQFGMSPADREALMTRIHNTPTYKEALEREKDLCMHCGKQRGAHAAVSAIMDEHWCPTPKHDGPNRGFSGKTMFRN